MVALDRRSVLMGMGAALVDQHPLAAAPVAWQRAAPADAGFAPDIEARLDQYIAGEPGLRLHGVIAARGRRIVLERYFESADERWGKPLGRVHFGPETLHDLRSISKSIVALVYGVALAEKKVPPPGEPLFTQFPEYADLFDADERRKRLTIEHALTMTLGTAWDEGISYANSANSERVMETAPDRYRYVLERPVVEDPGQRWVYSGGATSLIGRIIAKGTGQSLPSYARAALFEPAGLGSTEWIVGREVWPGTGDGEPAAASGVRMTPRDLVRLGQLILDNGTVNGRQVVPASWIAACLTPRVQSDPLTGYGYQWYIGEVSVGPAGASRAEPWVGAFGNGGQLLFVMPRLGIVVAATAGHYNVRRPFHLLTEVVLQNLL
jgi:CubicO group peptidase (beta-lactamase class C family)